MAGEYVLLTGGTGMIGFRTLVHLLQGGYKVRAAVRNQAGFDRISAIQPIPKYASQLESFIVPDITVPGAYDEAVKGGIKYIVHIASPLSNAAPTGDYENDLIAPAKQGTIGILESAIKVPGIQRIVITASILSIVSVAHLASGERIDEDTREPKLEGPFESDISAYAASKAQALKAAEEFLVQRKPSFDIINVLPVFVLGRDELVTAPAGIVKGTNALLMAPFVGHAHGGPLLGGSVELDDVARIHVLSLNPSVKGNQNFLAASHSPDGVQWADAIDIVKKRFPKAYADGVFKFDSVPVTKTLKVTVDSTRATEVLGIKFRSFEEQVVSVVGHYLELLGKPE